MFKLCLFLLCFAGLQAEPFESFTKTMEAAELKSSFDDLLKKYPLSNVTELAEEYDRSGYATFAQIVRQHILTDEGVAEWKHQIGGLPAESTNDTKEQFVDFKHKIARQKKIYEIVSNREKFAETLKERALLIAAINGGNDTEKYSDVKNIVIELAKAGNPENGKAIDELYQKIKFESKPLLVPEYRFTLVVLRVEAYTLVMKLGFFVDSPAMGNIRKIGADIEKLQKKIKENQPLESEEKVQKFWELLPAVITQDKQFEDELESKFGVECNYVGCTYTTSAKAHNSSLSVNVSLPVFLFTIFYALSY